MVSQVFFKRYRALELGSIQVEVLDFHERPHQVNEWMSLLQESFPNVRVFRILMGWAAFEMLDFHIQAAKFYMPRGSSFRVMGFTFYFEEDFRNEVSPRDAIFTPVAIIKG